MRVENVSKSSGSAGMVLTGRNAADWGLGGDTEAGMMCRKAWEESTVRKMQHLLGFL